MRELMFSIKAADCKWAYFTAGGKGGQHQNKTATACRVTHPPSGAVGESREFKSQLQNRRAAWRRMAKSPEMQGWIRMRAAGVQATETKVDLDLSPQNLRVEGKDSEGRWVVLA